MTSRDFLDVDRQTPGTIIALYRLKWRPLAR